MAKFVPAYEDYSVDALRGVSVKDLRREYTRMRDVAQKRVKRLQKEFPEAKAGQKVVKLYNDKGEVVKEYLGFRELKDIHPNDLTKALSEMAKFVNAKTSTVTGQRQRMRKTMSTLNKAIGGGKDGQAGVTKENYWRVIKILEEARKQKILYGSDKIVTLAEDTLELSDSQFDSVLDNLAKSIENADDFRGSLESYMKKKRIKQFQKVNMDDFIKKIGR